MKTYSYTESRANYAKVLDDVVMIARKRSSRELATSRL